MRIVLDKISTFLLIQLAACSEKQKKSQKTKNKKQKTKIKKKTKKKRSKLYYF